MLFGGPLLFLAARAGYQRLVFGATTRTQLVALGALVLVGAAALAASALVASAAAVAVLGGLVAAEILSQGASRAQPARPAP
jgi:low temperature requirement protein LtrA